MKRNSIFYIVAVVALTGLFVFVSNQVDSEETDIYHQASSGLKIVGSENVCMINDQLFSKEQIPVEVDGKTYYGCCKMCEKTLRTDPSSRIAKDLVSGKKVDKAQSVKGATANGQVYYFENEQNLKEFNQSLNK